MRRKDGKPRQVKNLTGKSFGRLTVQQEAYRSTDGKVYWTCVCVCGNTTNVWTGSLNNGHTRSCGCLHVETRSKNGLKHGLAHVKEHDVWQQMRYRCSKHDHPSYPNYGGRGIKVCPRWDADFAAFIEDMGRCPEGMSLDRINNDGDYEPSNCRWTTKITQANNTRRNVFLDLETSKNIKSAVKEDGISLREASRRFNVSRWTINRVLKGER